jgi:hypothetical protein
MCTAPLLNRVCRESYNSPVAVYEQLKRRGMDLVTITDHDGIDAVEELRRHSDFFLSEEVSCTLPGGRRLHVGVYDISERQHIELQRRRNDFPRLLSYLREQRLFFTANHIFSGLTGSRAAEDYFLILDAFPAFETLNGHMLPQVNAAADWLAALGGKARIAGSDAHAMATLGRTYTEVRWARSKAEFLSGVRWGMARLCGESGSYSKLTADVLTIGCRMVKEQPVTAALLPLACLAPFVTAANYMREAAFARYWRKRLEREWAWAARSAEAAA